MTKKSGLAKSISGSYNCFTGAFVLYFSAVYAFKKAFGVFKFIIVSKEAFDDFGIAFVLFGAVLTVAIHQYCIVIAGRSGVSTERRIFVLAAAIIKKQFLRTLVNVYIQFILMGVTTHSQRTDIKT